MRAASPRPVPSPALGCAGREGAAPARRPHVPTASPRPHVPSPIFLGRVWRRAKQQPGAVCVAPAVAVVPQGCSAARGQRAAAPGLCRAALRLQEPPASPASLRPLHPCVPASPCPAAGQQTLNQATHLGGNPWGAGPSWDPPPDTLMALGCALTLRCLGDALAVPCTPWGHRSCAMHPMGTLWPQQPCHAPHGDTVAVPCTPSQCPVHATCVLHPMGTSRPRLGPRGDVLAVPATSHAPWGQTGCTLHPVGTRWPCWPCPEHGAPRGQATVPATPARCLL